MEEGVRGVLGVLIEKLKFRKDLLILNNIDRICFLIHHCTHSLSQKSTR